MANQNPADVPKASFGDKAHALVRGVIGAVPVAGSVAAEVFGMILSAPLDKRREEWMENVAENLRTLEEQGKTRIDDLKDDPAFISTLLQASQSAMKNHTKEKLDALRNAVLNSAIPQRPDEVRRDMFVCMIDDLTVLHLRILALLANPIAWFRANGHDLPRLGMSTGVNDVVLAAFPDLHKEKDLSELAVEDLMNRGLLKKFSYGAMMSADGAMSARGSDLGAQFAKFISEPPKD